MSFPSDPDGTGSTPADPPAHTPSTLRRNAVPIAVVGVMAVIGCLLGPQVAPELEAWRTCLGGVMLGAFSGGAAVLNRLLEMPPED